jgi:hypothetical protein
MRSAGAAWRRTAAHKFGARANTLASGGCRGERMLSFIVWMKSGTLSPSPASAVATIAARRGALGKPAAAAAAMITRTISAGRMARKPRSLLSPSVETKIHEMMRPGRRGCRDQRRKLTKQRTRLLG